jgi:ribosomal protein S18 acetylase RimI-like enzyme
MGIRIAELRDAHEIATVHVRSWQVAYRGIVPDEFLRILSIETREARWRELLSLTSPETWVAEVEARVVGWISFGASRDDDALSNVGEVHAIYVLADHWSTGVGWQLWLKARQRLRELNFERATLWVLAENARAIGFYRAAGFIPSSTRVVDIGGKSLSEIRYEVQI